jgi:hypothetical protein
MRRRPRLSGDARFAPLHCGVATREPAPHADGGKYIGDDLVRQLICLATGHSPSVFEPRTDAQRAAVTQALKTLNRAVFGRNLIADYLIQLRPELLAFIGAADGVRRTLDKLMRTRDSGDRWMEEVANAVYEDAELSVGIRFLRDTVLGHPARDREWREHHPQVPRSVFEVVEDLMALVDARLLEHGEKPRGRGRPQQHPVINEAIGILRAARMTTAEIQAAIGNEIEALRVHVQQTRNRKGYDKARDPKRGLRRRRKRRPVAGHGAK